MAPEFPRCTVPVSQTFYFCFGWFEHRTKTRSNTILLHIHPDFLALLSGTNLVSFRAWQLLSDRDPKPRAFEDRTLVTHQTQASIHGVVRGTYWVLLW